jgi:hypothetical protein
LTLERRELAESVQAMSRIASARIAQSDRSRFTNTSTVCELDDAR